MVCAAVDHELNPVPARLGQLVALQAREVASRDEGRAPGYRPAGQGSGELTADFAGDEKVSFAKLVRELRRRANAYYELLWTSCTRKEKLVLIQLAQEGFVTAQSWDVAAPLVAKGLIVERPVPTIFNHTFRDFLMDIERSGVVQEWGRMDGNGLWQISGRLIGASLLAGGLFYLLTQDFSVQSLLPIASGTGMFGHRSSARLSQRCRDGRLMRPHRRVTEHSRGVSLSGWLRFRISVGASADIHARVSHLAERGTASLKHAHAASGASAVQHLVAKELLSDEIPERQSLEGHQDRAHPRG